MEIHISLWCVFRFTQHCSTVKLTHTWTDLYTLKMFMVIHFQCALNSPIYTILLLIILLLHPMCGAVFSLQVLAEHTPFTLSSPLHCHLFPPADGCTFFPFKSCFYALNTSIATMSRPKCFQINSSPNSSG